MLDEVKEKEVKKIKVADEEVKVNATIATPKKAKMKDSEKIYQLSKAVHFLASMMGADTFKMAVDNFPVLTDSE